MIMYNRRKLKLYNRRFKKKKDKMKYKKKSHRKMEEMLTNKNRKYRQIHDYFFNNIYINMYKQLIRPFFKINHMYYLKALKDLKRT